MFVYDVTDPERPAFDQVLVNPDFDITFSDLSENPSNPGRAGDFSPEGLAFITTEDSPIDAPLLAASYEVSGTVALFKLTADGYRCPA